jgi:hypothetical protein
MIEEEGLWKMDEWFGMKMWVADFAVRELKWAT